MSDPIRVIPQSTLNLMLRAWWACGAVFGVGLSAGVAVIVRWLS